MERIGDELRHQLGRFGPAAGMAELVAAWPAAMGEEIAKNAWPARLSRDGTLHVSVSSAAWAFELTQLETTVLERLRSAAGDAAPARLRFAPGPLPEKRDEGVKTVKRVPPRPGAEDQARARQIAARVADDRLRDLVRRAAAASLARAADDRSV